MRNLLTKLRYVPKSFAVAAAVVVAGAATALTFAWGPDRPTYTVENPADHITFNSITNNPNVGDERNFVVVKDAAITADGGWQDSVNVEPGKEYLVRMYVHNNAASSRNLTALNTRVTAALGTNTGTKVDMTGFVSADNSDPLKVWDDISFTSANTFNMVYVPGSAMIYNNATGPSGRALGDDIMNGGGTLVGYNANDGKVPGCFQYASYVYIKVKPQFAATPNFEVAKTVSKHDAFQWGENVSVNPGDLVDFRVKYSNTGQTQQDNVVVKDELPTGMSYVAGSTKLYNNLYPNGQVLPDTIGGGGVNIGNHAAGSASFVVFTAKVATNDQLVTCGANTLTNTARVETDNGYKTDTATVSVTKTCEQPTPTAECKMITPHVISRTEFSFDGQAAVTNGATVSKYTFVVKNAAGTVVKTATVTSTELNVNSGTITLSDTGVYTVVLTVTTSLGDKTASQCQTTVEVKPADNDIQVCRLSDKVIVTIKESEFDAAKYSKNLDDCKPETKMIQVCELATDKVISIKETDFDATKHSKDLAACEKIQVCELSSDTVITIRKTDFDAAKHSKTLSDCDKIKVCVIASGEVKTIKRTDFDNKTQSTNLGDCKDINVCRLSDKHVVTIKETAFDSALYSRDVNDCKVLPVSTTKPAPAAPTAIASTGPEMIAGGLLGSSALGLGISSYVRSRRALIGAHLSR